MTYTVSWFAVHRNWRRRGIVHVCVNYALENVAINFSNASFSDTKTVARNSRPWEFFLSNTQPNYWFCNAINRSGHRSKSNARPVFSSVADKIEITNGTGVINHDKFPAARYPQNLSVILYRVLRG